MYNEIWIGFPIISCLIFVSVAPCLFYCIKKTMKGMKGEVVSISLTGTDKISFLVEKTQKFSVRISGKRSIKRLIYPSLSKYSLVIYNEYGQEIKQRFSLFGMKFNTFNETQREISTVNLNPGRYTLIISDTSQSEKMPLWKKLQVFTSDNTIGFSYKICYHYSPLVLLGLVFSAILTVASLAMSIILISCMM